MILGGKLLPLLDSAGEAAAGGAAGRERQQQAQDNGALLCLKQLLNQKYFVGHTETMQSNAVRTQQLRAQATRVGTNCQQRCE
eukprot:363789-Chlamydomonas_euryale.AAC.9